MASQTLLEGFYPQQLVCLAVQAAGREANLPGFRACAHKDGQNQEGGIAFKTYFLFYYLFFSSPFIFEQRRYTECLLVF